MTSCGRPGETRGQASPEHNLAKGAQVTPEPLAERGWSCRTRDVAVAADWVARAGPSTSRGRSSLGVGVGQDLDEIKTGWGQVLLLTRSHPLPQSLAAA